MLYDGSESTTMHKQFGRSVASLREQGSKGFNRRLQRVRSYVGIENIVVMWISLFQKSGPKNIFNQARAPVSVHKTWVPNLFDQPCAPGSVTNIWPQIFPIKPVPRDLFQKSGPKSFR